MAARKKRTTRREAEITAAVNEVRQGAAMDAMQGTTDMAAEADDSISAVRLIEGMQDAAAHHNPKPRERLSFFAAHFMARYLRPLEERIRGLRRALQEAHRALEQPTPMLLWCPECGTRHVDEGEWVHRHHHTHACQECGHVWRPAVSKTVGVQYLPGFKNGTSGRR